MVFHRLSASQPKSSRKLYMALGVVAALVLVVLAFRLYPL
jgi:hypothetical protein